MMFRPDNRNLVDRPRKWWWRENKMAISDRYSALFPNNRHIVWWRGHNAEQRGSWHNRCHFCRWGICKQTSDRGFGYTGIHVGLFVGEDNRKGGFALGYRSTDILPIFPDRWHLSHRYGCWKTRWSRNRVQIVRLCKQGHHNCKHPRFYRVGRFVDFAHRWDTDRSVSILEDHIRG